MVETALLFFRSSTDLSLYLRATDDCEMPGLLIGAAGSASRTGNPRLFPAEQDGKRTAVLCGAGTFHREMTFPGSPFPGQRIHGTW